MTTPTTPPTRTPHRYWLAGLLALALVGGGAIALTLGATPHDAHIDTILGVTRESPGEVTVVLTPETFGDARLTVFIAINTHSVDDLDRYDLTRITTLELPSGSVSPVAAPRLSGHHNSGELAFPVEALPDSLAIVIRGLDDPAERVFTWP